MDYLTEMVKLQEKLQVNSYGGVRPQDLTDDQKIEFIRWNILALEDELHEALGETGWKPWATSRHINQTSYLSELVDAFHFFMNLMLVVDITPAELHYKYVQKNKRNAERQLEGYDGIQGKCTVCKRAFDDDGVNCRPGTEWTPAVCMVSPDLDKVLNTVKKV